MTTETEKIAVHFTEGYEEARKMFVEGFHLKAIAIGIYILATGCLAGAIVLLIMSFSIPPGEIENNLQTVEMYIGIAFIFIICIGMYSIPFTFNRGYKKSWEKEGFSSKTYSWEISIEQILIRSDINENNIAWEDISKVREVNNCFKFYVGKGTIKIPMFLPKKPLDQSRIMAIRNIVQKTLDPKNVRLQSE